MDQQCPCLKDEHYLSLCSFAHWNQSLTGCRWALLSALAVGHTHMPSQSKVLEKCSCLLTSIGVMGPQIHIKQDHKN